MYTAVAQNKSAIHPPNQPLTPHPTPDPGAIHNTTPHHRQHACHKHRMIDDTPLARLLAVIFFAVFIFASAPIAYHLADVERFPIDHVRIQGLKQIQSNYTVTVTVHAKSCTLPSDMELWSNNPQLHHSLMSIFQAKLVTTYDKPFPQTSTSFNLQHPSTVITLLDIEQPTRSHEMNIAIIAVPSPKEANEGQPNHSLLHVGPTRRSVIYVSCNAHATVSRDLSMVASHLHVLLGTDRTKHTDVVSVPKYRLSMTLLDASPMDRQEGISMSWSGSTMATALAPFLHRLEDIMEVELDTQIVRFAAISEKVHQSCGKTCTKEQNSSYFVTPQDLQRIRSMLSKGFSLESGAVSPLISPLHVILYVPPSQETPLYVVASKKIGRTIDGTHKIDHANKEEDRNRLGFYVPRYGGIAVWNVQNITRDCDKESNRGSSSTTCAPSEVVLDITSDLWVSQLRQVLGVNTVQTTNKNMEKMISYIRSSSGISDWELDVLARGRLSHFSELTIKSLTSLSSLVQDMSHMAVPAPVGQHVVASLEQYEDAALTLTKSRHDQDDSIIQALKKMAKAFDYARLAEMNPTMAPLRYFPPEHLAAVYVPLIIPLFIPIVSGLKNGFRDYMNKGGK